MNWLRISHPLERIVMEDLAPTPTVRKLTTILCGHPQQRWYYRKDKEGCLHIGQVCNLCGQIQEEARTTTEGIPRRISEDLFYGSESISDRQSIKESGAGI